MGDFLPAVDLTLPPETGQTSGVPPVAVLEFWLAAGVLVLTPGVVW